VTGTSSYFVEVGDGQKVRCSGVCKAVQLKLHGVEVQQYFYLFRLGGANVVFGIRMVGWVRRY